jgi:hypothetical protein
MITAIDLKNIDSLIEQKMLEFFGDPDSGLEIKQDFLDKIKNRSQGEEKLVDHNEVLKQYDC